MTALNWFISWLIAVWTLVVPRISLEIVSCGGLQRPAVIGWTRSSLRYWGVNSEESRNMWGCSYTGLGLQSPVWLLTAPDHTGQHRTALGQKWLLTLLWRLLRVRLKCVRQATHLTKGMNSSRHSWWNWLQSRHGLVQCFLLIQLKPKYHRFKAREINTSACQKHEPRWHLWSGMGPVRSGVTRCG